MPAVFSLQDHRETHLRLCGTNHPHNTPAGTGGLRHGNSAVDQVTLLKQDLDDSFSAKEAGAVFVDLTAAYGTVWHRAITSKIST